jgi:uncharacterized protein (DUF2141 family)
MLTAIILAAAIQTTPAVVSTGQDLTVIVEGVADDKGVVRLELCRQDTFLTSSCDITQAVKAQRGEVSVVVPAVPEGEYAIQAYHDRNEDGHVDRNLLGIPTEEVGFSRSPPMGLKGPSFSKAAFVHTSEPQTVTVKLRRFW